MLLRVHNTFLCLSCADMLLLQPTEGEFAKRKCSLSAHIEGRLSRKSSPWDTTVTKKLFISVALCFRMACIFQPKDTAWFCQRSWQTGSGTFTGQQTQYTACTLDWRWIVRCKVMRLFTVGGMVPQLASRSSTPLNSSDESCTQLLSEYRTKDHAERMQVLNTAGRLGLSCGMIA